MTNYRNRIGEAIAFARNMAGRSQQELADMLGRDKRTIQKWERGEIRIALHNHSRYEQSIEPFERVAQLVIMPYVYAQFEETDELSDTVRGEGGFGSTGNK